MGERGSLLSYLSKGMLTGAENRIRIRKRRWRLVASNVKVEDLGARGLREQATPGNGQAKTRAQQEGANM